MSRSTRNTVRGLSLFLVLAMAGVGTFFVQDGARGQEADHDAQAKKVLQNMADYYKGMDNFAVDATLVRKAKIQGRSMDSTVSYQMAMERPNKFVMKPGEGNGGQGGGVVASDGKTLVMYVPEVDKYTKEESPESLDALMENRVVAMLSGGIGGFVGTLMTSDPYASLTEQASGSSYVGKEEVDGQGYHRVRVQRQGGAYDLWIADGEKPTLHKMVPDLSKQLERAQQAGQNVEMEVELRMDKWQPNAELAGDRFAYSPPESAQKVDSFFEEQQQSSGGGQHALVGKAAPGFELGQLGGGKVDLASHKGENIVILDFWATWCGPCVKAMPIIEKVASEYEDKGVVLYAVNLREGKDKIQGFLDDHGLDVNVLLDKQGAVAQKYQASSIPQTVIIDKDGSVQAVHVGLLPDLESKLSGELEKLVAGEKLVN